MDLVRPLMACLLAVYATEPGRGEQAHDYSLQYITTEELARE